MESISPSKTEGEDVNDHETESPEDDSVEPSTGSDEGTKVVDGAAGSLFERAEVAALHEKFATIGSDLDNGRIRGREMESGVDVLVGQLRDSSLMKKAVAVELIEELRELVSKHKKVKVAGEVAADSLAGYFRVHRDGRVDAKSDLDGINDEHTSKFIEVILFPVFERMMMASNGRELARTISIMVERVRKAGMELCGLLDIDYIDFIVIDSASYVRPPYYMRDFAKPPQAWVPSLKRVAKFLVEDVLLRDSCDGFTILVGSTPFAAYLMAELCSQSGATVKKIDAHEIFSGLSNSVRQFDVVTASNNSHRIAATDSHPSSVPRMLHTIHISIFCYMHVFGAPLEKAEEVACLPDNVRKLAAPETLKKIVGGISEALGRVTPEVRARLTLEARKNASRIRTWLSSGQKSVSPIVASLVASALTTEGSASAIAACSIRAACGGEGEAAIDTMWKIARGERRDINVADLRAPLRKWQLREVLLRGLDGTVGLRIAFLGNGGECPTHKQYVSLSHRAGEKLVAKVNSHFGSLALRAAPGDAGSFAASAALAFTEGRSAAALDGGIACAALAAAAHAERSVMGPARHRNDAALRRRATFAEGNGELSAIQFIKGVGFGRSGR